MKLLLLHGPAIISSRKHLTEIKSKFDSNNVVLFDKGDDIKDVINSLTTPSLLNNDQLVVWENPSEEFTPYPLYPIPCTLLLWFDHEVDIKKYPNFQSFFFPESKEVSIFPLLDSLGSKDKKAFMEIDKFKKLDNQYLITMIFYLLRNLVATPKKAADFVKRKNQKMRENFSEEELVNLYKYVLDLDFKIKSGLIEENLLKFLIIKKFTEEAG